MLSRRDFLKLSFLLPVFAKTQFANVESVLAKKEPYAFEVSETNAIGNVSPSHELHIENQYPIQFPISFTENKHVEQKYSQNRRRTIIELFFPRLNK